MGCAPSSEMNNGVQEKMVQVDDTTPTQKAVFFEIPADDLVVKSKQPAVIERIKASSIDHLNQSSDDAAAQLKEKEEKAERNRQAELAKKQEQAAEQARHAQAVRERKQKVAAINDNAAATKEPQTASKLPKKVNPAPKNAAAGPSKAKKVQK